MLEQAVIGHILMNNKLAFNCGLSCDDFTIPLCSESFQDIDDLLREGREADVISVSDKAKARGKNVLSVLGGWCKNTFSEISFAQYCIDIKKETKLRKAHEVANKLINELGSEGAIESAVSDLIDLSQEADDTTQTLNKAMIDAKDIYEAGQQQGIATSSSKLDYLIGGWRNSMFITVAGRPGMGKTAFLLNSALAANCSVGFVSAEQGALQLGQRAISCLGGISGQKMIKGEFNQADWGNMTTALAAEKTRNLHIYDKAGMTIGDVELQAIKWVNEYSIKALYVDYTQKLINPDKSMGKAEKIGDNASRLKNLAKKLDIPIIALAQVNREVERRDDKRPTIADLYFSSEIEMESDIIILLYRDVYYNPNTQSPNLMELNVGKNRHGPVGVIPVKYNSQFMRVENL